MESLETELERARALDPGELADAIESIGFECTRCGACCKSEAEDPHTATVFPDEVRTLQGRGEPDSRRDATASDSDASREYDWRDVARPMPYGLHEGEDGPEGETFEWALATDGCGDCTFYEEDDGVGACTVHEDRPLICRTYPFSVVLSEESDSGVGQPMGEAVDSVALETQRAAGEAGDREGAVRAHECEGLGREIDREDAEKLAEALKERAIRELEEAIDVRENYRSIERAPGEVVVHDSEGPKTGDGAPVAGADTSITRDAEN